MRAAIPTELLMRLMNATPEQFAAIAKILGVSAECGVRSRESSTPHPQSLSPVEAERGYFAALQSRPSRPSAVRTSGTATMSFFSVLTEFAFSFAGTGDALFFSERAEF